MSGQLVFVDCETTGLDPTRHEVWEVAMFSPGVGWEILQRSPKYLNRAEQEALLVNRFYEKRSVAARTRVPGQPEVELLEDDLWAQRVARRLSGATMAGIGPWFDSEMLKYQLRRLGHAPSWDHRVVDCKALAVGFVLGRRGLNDPVHDEAFERLSSPPFSTRDICDVLGVDRGDAHTAYADVVTAVRLYEAVMGVEFLS